MADADVECQLGSILSHQHIGAAIFTPFVITRLQDEGQATAAKLSVELRDIGDVPREVSVLRLRWEPDSVPTLPMGVQEKTVTEWAACGIACAIISVYTKLQIFDVAEEGDRFDYWLAGDGQDYGLEVSGTLSDDRNEIEARHRMKVRQLRENPYGVNGFVVVANFTTREVILSFNRYAEELAP